ncbi:MAG: hypothetical protein J3R72DRAFT_516116, partial [Linnemannia gamsii]
LHTFLSNYISPTLPNTSIFFCFSFSIFPFPSLSHLFLLSVFYLFHHLLLLFPSTLTHPPAQHNNNATQMSTTSPPAIPETDPLSPTTPTPTTTTTSREPSLGKRASTICGLVLGGMVLLAVLATLIAFRRALIFKCSGGRFCGKPGTVSQLAQGPRRRGRSQGLEAGGPSEAYNVRPMEEAWVDAPSALTVGGRDCVEFANARTEMSTGLGHQQSTLSSIFVEDSTPGTRPITTVISTTAGEGVVFKDIPTRRYSQDSVTSSIHSNLTVATTIINLTGTHTPVETTTGVAETSAGRVSTDDNTCKRRSVWQDILQSFKASTSADSVAAVPATIIQASGSDVIEVSASASISVAADSFPDANINTNTTHTSTNDPATCTGDTTPPRASTTIAASFYRQASSSKTLPPIIYCPRERAELDFLRQRYPTAAPGYTAYRLPPEGVTSPPSIAASLFSGSGGGSDASSSRLHSRSRPRSMASSTVNTKTSTKATRISFGDEQTAAAAQDHRTSIITSNSNSKGNNSNHGRRSVTFCANGSSSPGPTTTRPVTTIPTSTMTTTTTRAQRPPISTSTSLPILLYHSNTTPTLTSTLTPATTPAFITTPINTPTLTSTTTTTTITTTTPSRKPRTIRDLLLLPLPTLSPDPTQSENHISNYFARNTRPDSYPKIYAPSYGDVEDFDDADVDVETGGDTDFLDDDSMITHISSPPHSPSITSVPDPTTSRPTSFGAGVGTG